MHHRRTGLVVGLLLLMSALAAIPFLTMRSKAELSIIVSVHVCPTNSSDCYDLRVPNVDVLVKGPDKTHVGVTDARGEIQFTVHSEGQYRVQANSFVMRNGVAERQVEVSFRRQNSAKLIADIAADGT